LKLKLSALEIEDFKMTFQKADFVVIDYTAKVKETNEVFDTTKEDVAKKEHLHKEGEIYEPKLVVVGEGWVLKSLDDSLTTMEINTPATVEISPEKGFGQRDPEKVKHVPLRQLLAKEINPVIGARIEYQGKMASVRAIGAGRVLLDYNPPLAGKTLIYEVVVNKKIEDSEEKISALVHRRIPQVEEKQFKITLQDKALTIDMPEVAFYIEGVQIAKRGIAIDIQKFLPDLTETKFVETFKAEPKVAVPAPTAPSAEPAPTATTPETAPVPPAPAPETKTPTA
jgi:peptidylprolyl isomerase